MSGAKIAGRHFRDMETQSKEQCECLSMERDGILRYFGCFRLNASRLQFLLKKQKVQCIEHRTQQHDSNFDTIETIKMCVATSFPLRSEFSENITMKMEHKNSRGGERSIFLVDIEC